MGHTLPILAARSKIVTSKPPCRQAIAAASPPSPAPTMTTFKAAAIFSNRLFEDDQRKLRSSSSGSAVLQYGLRLRLGYALAVQQAKIYLLVVRPADSSSEMLTSECSQLPTCGVYSKLYMFHIVSILQHPSLCALSVAGLLACFVLPMLLHLEGPEKATCELYRVLRVPLIH